MGVEKGVLFQEEVLVVIVGGWWVVTVVFGASVECPVLALWCEVVGCLVVPEVGVVLIGLLLVEWKSSVVWDQIGNSVPPVCRLVGLSLWWVTMPGVTVVLWCVVGSFVVGVCVVVGVCLVGVLVVLWVVKWVTVIGVSLVCLVTVVETVVVLTGVWVVGLFVVLSVVKWVIVTGGSLVCCVIVVGAVVVVFTELPVVVGILVVLSVVKWVIVTGVSVVVIGFLVVLEVVTTGGVSVRWVVGSRVILVTVVTVSSVDLLSSLTLIIVFAFVKDPVCNKKCLNQVCLN